MTPRPSLGESFAAFWPVVSGIRPTSWPLTKTSVPLVSSSLPLSRVRTSARVSSSSSKPSKASAPSSAVGVIVFSLGSLFPAPPAAAFSFFATDFPAGTDLVDFFFLLATGESSAAAATVSYCLVWIGRGAGDRPFRFTALVGLLVAASSRSLL